MTSEQNSTVGNAAEDYARAVEIVRSCATSDYRGETGGNIDAPSAAIDAWREVSYDAEDDETVAAIDLLGDDAPAIYARQIARLRSDATGKG